MSDLTDLYQEVILDHGRNPRNFRAMADATATAEGLNPLCGDHYHVFLRMDGDRIDDVSFQGNGCAISKAVGLAHERGAQGQVQPPTPRTSSSASTGWSWRGTPRRPTAWASSRS